MATVLSRRPRSWTPKAIPFGLLILLLGLGAFYPVWASGTIEPYGSELMRGLRWLGQLLGPGGLVLWLSGWAQGLFMRRTIVEQAPPAPLETTQVTTPE